ncbi:HNH endonuclease [Rhodococcus opacus]|uniref:HNH endonuclease n=1 Tax=Rhodococcus opacus TaxID=37919 RepID=UPI001FF3A313|nr:HNH endonuclease [Rhodococcus opacus]UOT02127.1 HNH endonuclease [Rhodococcus opacus]
MALNDITHPAVLAAIREYDELGQRAFLQKYGYGEARSYLLHYEGKQYDSKAIAGVAHGKMDGRDPLIAAKFNGGDDTVAKHLRALGFDVPPPLKPLDWLRDELILACELVADNGWKALRANDSRVIALSELLQQLPLHPSETRPPNFRSPGSVRGKTWNISTRLPGYAGKPTKGNALDKVVLEDFLAHEGEMRATAQAIRAGIKSGSLLDVDSQLVDIDELDDEAPEGRLLQRKHFARERSKSLRKRKIERHLQTNGTLACAVCDFDFNATYGDHGDGYIECHHVVPLHASGEKKTRLEDLILLCANCHRMIHRRSPWLTPDELRQLTRRS